MKPEYTYFCREMSATEIRIGKWKVARKRFRLGIAAFLILSLLVFAKSILGMIGNYLIVEDPKSKVDAIFVLSGNSLDRGAEAAKLWKEGWAPKLVCLGGEPHSALELYGIHDLSFEMTRKVLREHEIPESAIDSLPEGTSTAEEFEAITRYCKSHQMKKIMVVSSLFHTRRIDEFFRLRLYFEGIEMVLRGAKESGFKEESWWVAEPGLLFVNSEYIKMAYYHLRY